MGIELRVLGKWMRCAEKGHQPEKVPQTNGLMYVYCPMCNYQSLRRQYRSEIPFARAYHAGKARSVPCEIPLLAEPRVEFCGTN